MTIATPPRPLISRAPGPADDGFQRRLFEADRCAQLSVSGLPGELVTQMLEQQYAGFGRMLESQATESELWLCGDEPVAVLYLARPTGSCEAGRGRRTPAPVTEVVWLTVTPERRGMGIGSTVLASLLARTDAAGHDVRVRVDPVDLSARGFYTAAGFAPARAGRGAPAPAGAPTSPCLTLCRPAARR